MSANIIPTLQRKTPIVAAAPDRYGYLRAAADTLDRRVADGAVVELLAEALHRLVTLVYAQDGAGLVNVDGATGRILIPVPWGRAGRAKWGLYPSEGDTLRSLLRERRRSAEAVLFVYDASCRAWYVDLVRYPGERSAYAYLTRHPIALEEYRLHSRRTRRRRR